MPEVFKPVFTKFDDLIDELAVFAVRVDPIRREEDLPSTDEDLDQIITKEGEEYVPLTYGDAVIWFLRSVALCYLRQAYSQVKPYVQWRGTNLVADIDSLIEDGIMLLPSSMA